MKRVEVKVPLTSSLVSQLSGVQSISRTVCQVIREASKDEGVIRGIAPYLRRAYIFNNHALLGPENPPPCTDLIPDADIIKRQSVRVDKDEDDILAYLALSLDTSKERAAFILINEYYNHRGLLNVEDEASEASGL